jgi:phosphatidyl-myo-inositol dimannoside synthase
MDNVIPDRRVCVLSASTFSQEGGIQQVTRMLLRCLKESWPSTTLDLVSLHDTKAQEPDGALSTLPELGLSDYHACNSSRFRFCSLALRDIIGHHPKLVIADHAHLSVLPWLTRRIKTFQSVSFLHYAELSTLGPLRRRALRRADLLIAVSEFTAEATRRVLGPECPVKVCHLGLHSGYAQWAQKQRSRPTALEGRRAILIVGRMADVTRDKGHEALIRAMPAVAKCVPDCLLAIVGRGSDEARLRALCSELGVTAHVHFAGYVPDEELPAYYEAAEIFAMPSSSEGFGLVYLEAMHHGKPCIAGNRDGAREVVSDGETGLLVEPGNVQQLQEALLRLLQDRETAKALGAAGRARLNQHFTYESFAARLTKLLSPLMLTPAKHDHAPAMALPAQPPHSRRLMVNIPGSK